MADVTAFVWLSKFFLFELCVFLISCHHLNFLFLVLFHILEDRVYGLIKIAIETITKTLEISFEFFVCKLFRDIMQYLLIEEWL